jgi:hypothetical protein
MEPNIKIARAHRALSWLYGAVVLLFVVILFVKPENQGESSVFFISMSVIFGGLFLLHHFTAKGAREKKPWARISSCVIGVIMLPGFPMGTLIGVYLLIYANSAWTDSVAAGAGERVTGG